MGLCTETGVFLTGQRDELGTTGVLEIQAKSGRLCVGDPTNTGGSLGRSGGERGQFHVLGLPW